MTEQITKAPLPLRERGWGEGANLPPRQFAKALRQKMTDAENLLWRHLRAHRLQGAKFRRQQPLGPYIVDFVHFGARLVIEADGGQHQDAPIDTIRDAWLANHGFRVLRFWNNEILQNPEGVLAVVMEALTAAPLSPSPSPTRGEGRETAPTQAPSSSASGKLAALAPNSSTS